MKKLLTVLAALGLLGAAPFASARPNLEAPGTPHQDLQRFQAYFKHRFPKIPFADFANGTYAIGPKADREQWKSITQFPPYEPGLSHGKKLFHTAFKDGKTYGSCFAHDGIGIRQNYPYFDTKKGKVVTLEMAINQCREKNGAKPYKWGKGPLADISAYMGYTSRGKKFDIKVPDNPKARAAYERGKEFFYSKRGQLDMSCADCHVYHSGQKIRGNYLSTSLGQPTGFPTYRAKWGYMGTLEKRFKGCNKKVRAKPFKLQSVQYRDLEYFLTYMSDGQPVNAPAYRP
ncbi:MAG TPA: sulfur oxidation c-type cytochrome SoxA [Gammaproteobacteria bacterium]|nr:sulfur oxidation c-type cytochrome SoxA [Gammaproteobacteria bacterium]